MRIVVALGGNALLKRGEPLTMENQSKNIGTAVEALLPLIQADHQLVITHGNGPQVGLLAMQSFAVGQTPIPLDILGAETIGMIGYLIEQQLMNALPPEKLFATLLTQIKVNAHDPAFKDPTKPIGPVFNEADARTLGAKHGWSIARDGTKWRRVVPSPVPQQILEMRVIEMLVDQGVLVICIGGGGVPVVEFADGRFQGVEAVIDKDHASALLARHLKADWLLMLTDVDAVYQNWGTPEARAINHATPQDLLKLTLPAGSMAPKVEAACSFVSGTGKRAGIGKLQDAVAIIVGSAGTKVSINHDAT
jgi:carbamate kinase